MVTSSKIHIVDSHNKVLSAWADYRKILTHPPRLITLDHHTDTSRPFRRFIANNYGKSLSESQFNSIQKSLLGSIQYAEPLTVVNAIEKLNNDEHIVAAINSNIISSAFVIAHNAMNTEMTTYLDHKIICHMVNETFTVNGLTKPDYNIVLESSFLEQALKAFDDILTKAKEPHLLSEPYILDIDLDYFNTFKSIEPKDSSRFKELANNAGLVTIATEPEYVKNCAMDSGLTSKYLLNKLEGLLPENE